MENKNLLVETLANGTKNVCSICNAICVYELMSVLHVNHNKYLKRMGLDDTWRTLFSNKMAHLKSLYVGYISATSDEFTCYSHKKLITQCNGNCDFSELEKLASELLGKLK
jgi:hypothetical protein